MTSKCSQGHAGYFYSRGHVNCLSAVRCHYFSHFLLKLGKLNTSQKKMMSGRFNELKLCTYGHKGLLTDIKLILGLPVW